MSPREVLIAHRSRWLVAAIGVTLVVSAMAQVPAQAHDTSSMQEMPTRNGQQMRSQRAAQSMQSPPDSSPPAGEPMPGMDMHGMKMPDTPKAPPSKGQRPATQHHKSSAPAMPSMPMASSQPAELQQLHFGNMIGVRPKPGGLANGMQGTSSMQGGSAPAEARSADYSDGYRYGSMRGMDMPDDASLGMVMLDQLEYAYSTHGNAQFLDGEAWYGKNLDKLWVKAEGEVSRGRLDNLRTEALWDHAIATYWSTQLGVRHDFEAGPDRTWAVLGVQGLAPYWFDTEATLYVGEGGRTAARLQLEYEALLTQRLILQPKAEVNLYGRDDPQRAIGAGLSDAEFSLRLRYEIRRELAPYIGVVYRQRYGHSADFARARGEHTDELQFVTGLHAWF